MTEERSKGAGEGRRVGFIGTGHMGNPMAANLMKAGHALTVFDVRSEAAASLIDQGASWAGAPADVARVSEVVFLSLPTPPHVQEVVAGPAGLLASAARGSTIIDLSTNSPAVVRALAVEAETKGIAFLDAPVSGGVGGARKGTLSVMVGGDAATFERYRDVLAAIGDKVFHVGPVGTGNVAKLINNMLAFLGMMGTTEALVLGVKAGIDPIVLRDAVKAGSGASAMWDHASRLILKDRLAPAFTTTLAAKDIDLAVGLARDVGASVPLGERLQALLAGYRDGGFANEDLLATVRALEEIAGVVVRGLAKEL